MSEQITALTVIDDMDIRGIQRTMTKIHQFQQIVQSQLKQNHDYGIIPRTTKPTLFKPGAEKIFMLLGLRSEFVIVDSTRDFDNGFFQYQVKCRLFKGDTLITEGVGTANTRESKWIKNDPYSVDNTVLKMARKRAMTDAALTVGALSDIFTQDLEDVDIEGRQVGSQRRYYTDRDGTITNEQARRMFEIAGSHVDVVRDVMKKHGYEKSTQIKKIKYDKICEEIEQLVKEKKIKPGAASEDIKEKGEEQAEAQAPEEDPEDIEIPWDTQEAEETKEENLQE